MRNDLDEIKFGEMEFHTKYNDKNFIISTEDRMWQYLNTEVIEKKVQKVA